MSAEEVAVCECSQESPQEVIVDPAPDHDHSGIPMKCSKCGADFTVGTKYGGSKILCVQCRREAKREKKQSASAKEQAPKRAPKRRAHPPPQHDRPMKAAKSPSAMVSIDLVLGAVWSAGAAFRLDQGLVSRLTEFVRCRITPSAESKQ